MTPREQQLMTDVMRAALREELEPIAARIAALEEKDKKLEADDRKNSGQFRLVNGEIIPKLATSIANERTEDMKAVSVAFERVAHVLNDYGDQLARIDARQKLGLVAVPDGAGGTSIKPASMLAAESAQRTEGKADAIAVDTGGTANGVRSIQRSTKALLGIAGVPFLIEVVKLASVIVKAIAAHI